MKEKTERMMTFEVCITEHCNLNCVGCSHFAPLADPYFMDVKVFRKDMACLSSLLDDRVEWIHIMGGEPLLHPKCTEFLAVTREYFPSTRIDLITNALLLPYQSDEFWKTCRDQRISLKPTRYPVTVDLRKVRETAESWGVMFRIFNHEDDGGEKKMIKYVLDPDGQQTPSVSFDRCDQGNRCMTLKEGKMYTCPTIPFSAHFSKYFGIELPVCERDYADIYKLNSAEQLFEAMAKAPDFCRFCDHRNNIFGLQWHVSKRQIGEWTKTQADTPAGE